MTLVLTLHDVRSFVEGTPESCLPAHPILVINSLAKPAGVDCPLLQIQIP